MRPWYSRLRRWATGDWWRVTVTTIDGGKWWGICHEWRRHSWKHPYATRGSAQRECDKRNGKS